MNTGKIKTAKPVEVCITIPMKGMAIATVEIFTGDDGVKYVQAYLSSFRGEGEGSGIFRTMSYGSCDNDCPACYFYKIAQGFNNIGNKYHNHAVVLANFLELLASGSDDLFTNYIVDDVTERWVGELEEDTIRFREWKPSASQL